LELLEVAAYFGARFDVRDIAEFRAMAVEDVESLLWKTLHQGTGISGMMRITSLSMLTMVRTRVRVAGERLRVSVPARPGATSGV
jgi:hypothetical protein